MPEVKYFWEEPVSVSLIGESWEAAFGKRFDENEWNWRFRNNPYDSNVYAAYIKEDNKIACFYAVSPLTLITPKGSSLKSGLMNTGFTHPDYQGKGLYVEMNKQMHCKLKELEFQCIFGFANGNSHYSYRSYLDWIDIGILTNFRLNCDKIKHLAHDRQIKAEDITMSDSLLQEISEYVTCSDKFYVERNPDYLNWRLLKNPGNKYKAVGMSSNGILLAVAIYKFYENFEIDVMEIFYSKNEQIASYQILSGLVEYLSDKCEKAINIWSNLYSKEHLVLEKIGFMEDKFCTYFGYINLSDKIEYPKIDSWHYRFIDSDIY